MDTSTVLNYIKELFASLLILLTMMSPAFGDSGETFEATNIIGDITSDYESLEKLKEGVVVYVTESNNES